jgi:cytoskeletal protein RodZ
MAEIGKTLRDARMRAHIDVSEIEEQTKIRAKYLRALENEEWGLLPGATYTKSFLRVYAQTLGLDARALVDEYKAAYEHPGEGDRLEVVRRGRTQRSSRGQTSSGPPKLSRWYIAVAVGACALIVVALVGLLGSAGSSSTPHTNTRTAHTSSRRRGHAAHRGATAAVTGQRASDQAATAAGGGPVTVSLRATAKVWVCLEGEGGRRLIPGAVLSPQEAQPMVFRSKSFKLNLGNAHVELLVNGQLEPVRESSRPIGYAIDAAGRTALAAPQLPTCA